jgi:hypothetical protein
MMKKKVREGCALLMAVALVLSAFSMQRVQAANPIELDKLCSIDFSIAGEYSELQSAAGGVVINLYKVASTDASGAFTAAGEFAELDVSALENSDTSADTWMTRAGEAVKMMDGKTLTPDKTVTTKEGGIARMEEIPVGLYLVVADSVQSPYNTYDFTPYLISLPDNYYYTTGNDDWIYNLTDVSLKPEQTPRYGSIRINKTLVNHHITMGEKTTCIFEVQVKPIDGEAYTKTITLAFGAEGTNSAVLDQIPAGAGVTVTEVYSGAGYKPSEGIALTQTQEIVADDVVEVNFQNEHDGTITGGYGVVNNFTLNDVGQYDVEQKADNSATAN